MESWIGLTKNILYRVFAWLSAVFEGWVEGVVVSRCYQNCPKYKMEEVTTIRENYTSLGFVMNYKSSKFII